MKCFYCGVLICLACFIQRMNIGLRAFFVIAEGLQRKVGKTGMNLVTKGGSEQYHN